MIFNEKDSHMDIASIAAAPEIKAAPDRIEDAFDGFMGAFEAFKDANDRRLDEIEKKLTSDVVTRCGSSAILEL